MQQKNTAMLACYERLFLYASTKNILNPPQMHAHSAEADMPRSPIQRLNLLIGQFGASDHEPPGYILKDIAYAKYILEYPGFHGKACTRRGCTNIHHRAHHWCYACQKARKPA